MITTRKQLIQAYIDFFKSKNHKEIPNSPLIPKNDPTVLFTTAGMHPLVPFLLGEKHALGKRLVNVQKCIRTGDIESVGDESHLTFFEMLGNWSLGDYFKKDAIEYSFEFLTKILGIKKEMLAISCFSGDKDAIKDEESAKTWENLEIEKERIAFLPKENNWWGPAGKTGPCGPDTEMFFWVGKGKAKGNPKTNEANWKEIWNDVFMQYNKDENSNYIELKQKNVDTGMGVERTLGVLQAKNDVYETECFLPLIKKIEQLSGKKYGKDNEETRSMRIIADHIKASCFILNEKMLPGNTEQGYVLRRLIRRAIRYGRFLGIKNFIRSLAEEVFGIYDDYSFDKKFILDALETEENKFLSLLEGGIKYFDKIKKQAKKEISGKEAFLLYQSYGFPIEMTIELAKENKLKVNIEEYKKEEKKHQKLSRTSTIGKFKSGLADNSEQVTKLHTATHLLLSALKQVLKKEIEQRGSNITAERARFDFSFDRKLTKEEIEQVEKLVNENINKELEVKKEELSIKQAREKNAVGIFEDKYKDIVSVYTIKDKNNIISIEMCSGPHVSNTGLLGKFKIIKEEASSQGVRRIKARLG